MVGAVARRRTQAQSGPSRAVASKSDVTTAKSSSPEMGVAGPQSADSLLGVAAILENAQPELIAAEAMFPGGDVKQASDAEVKKTLSIIVRRKAGPDHHPSISDQHVDVLLSTGEARGFFLDPNSKRGLAKMGADGIAADADWLMQNRAHYVAADVAKQQGVPSTMLTIEVTPEQAARFDEYWEKLAKDPGTFSMIGNNCSTHAADALQYAGIIGGEIPGLDTPDHLYQMLVEAFPEAVSESGYFDLQRGEDGSWSHSMAPLGDAGTAAP